MIDPMKPLKVAERLEARSDKVRRVRRIRGTHWGTASRYSEADLEMLEVSAALIRSLVAREEKMREALKPFADFSGTSEQRNLPDTARICMMTQGGVLMDWIVGVGREFKMSDVRRARALLSDPKGE